MNKTTDELIAEAHDNRQSEGYPDSQMLLTNLPVLLRGLCDFTLTEDSTKIEIARALVSVIDAVENVERETRH